MNEVKYNLELFKDVWLVLDNSSMFFLNFEDDFHKGKSNLSKCILSLWNYLGTCKNPIFINFLLNLTIFPRTW